MGQPPRRDPVEEFFSTHPSFFCPKLRGRIQRLFCFKRIISPKPGKGTYGSKKPDNLLDSYCRSGLCPDGQQTIRALGMEKDYLAWRTSEGLPPLILSADDAKK